MRKRWLNDKQPDENGDYFLIIENANGARVSTFKGKSIDEVADALADSQVHANREISRLRKPDTGKPPVRVEPKEITPADRLRLSGEITDPNSIVEAVEEIITKRQGIAPDRMGVEMGRMTADERDRYWGQEAQAFRDENPDFYPVPQNRDMLFDELRANGWDFTRNNLALCFQTLKDRGDALIPWPDDTQEQIPQEPIPAPAVEPTYINGGNGYANGKPTAQPAPSPRPRSVSTGLRHTDASASAPPPPQRKKYTRADIERMSRAEYNDKLRSDPDFRRQVDAMGA
jgi:hypothetical protein